MSKTLPSRGIRGRLILLLLIVLVPVLLIQAYIYYRAFETRKSDELQANLEVARAVAKNFETFLQHIVQSELAVGRAITRSRTNDRHRNRLLDKFRADNPAVRNVAWINRQGIVVATDSTGMVGIGVDVKDRRCFQDIMAGRDWSVSELIELKRTRKISFTMNRAIRNRQGELLGVVTASIMPDRLDSVLGIDRSKEAGVSLVDNEGMLVYRYPAMQYTMEQRNWLKRYPILEDSLKGKDVLTSVISQLTGEKRLVAFTPVPSIGWMASASRAEDEVMKAITSTNLLQAGLVFFVTLIGFGAAVAFSRPISSSIIGLRNHVLALGRGETEDFTPVSGPLELKDLANAFNEMAEKVRLREAALKGAHDEMEIRVQERTAELAKSNEELKSEIVERMQIESTLRSTEKKLREASAQRMEAQETERKRIARELHDSIAGMLSGIKFKIEAAIIQSEQESAAPDSLNALVPLMQKAIQETRRIIADLRPSTLDDLGLIAAVNLQCRNFEETYSHIRVEKRISLLEIEVPGALKLPIYRIVQEVLNNIGKHSKADLVNVSLNKMDSKIEVFIQDNGQGFDLQEVRSKESFGRGLGLDGITERAEWTGGTCLIESSIGKGTVIRASWPLAGPG